MLLGLTSLTAIGRFVRVWQAAEGPPPRVVAVRTGRSRLRPGRVDSRWRAWREDRVAGLRATRGGEHGARWRSRRREAPLTSRAGRVPAGPRAGAGRTLRHPRLALVAGSGLPARVFSPGAPARLRATYLTYTGLALGLRRLPEPMARFAAAVVALGMRQLRGATVRMRIAHLRRVLRDIARCRTGSENPREDDAPGVSAPTRAYWVDGARLPVTLEASWCSRDVMRRASEHLDQAMAAGAGVVMALPHVGSWEWGGAWLDEIGYPMTAVAEVLEPARALPSGSSTSAARSGLTHRAARRPRQRAVDKAPCAGGSSSDSCATATWSAAASRSSSSASARRSRAARPPWPCAPGRC